MKTGSGKRSLKYHLRKLPLAIGAVCISVMATAAQAVPTYVGFPAGAGFSASGPAIRDTGSSTRTGTYFNFAPLGPYGQLYFGETPAAPGNASSWGVSLNSGNTITGSEWMTFNQMSGPYVQLHGQTTLRNGNNNLTYNIDTYLDLVLLDSLNNPINWVTGASVGLASNVAFVADVTAAAASGGFHYQANLFACGGQNSNCVSVSQLYSDNHADSYGGMITSFATGYFTTPAGVPEPASLALLGLGLFGLGFGRRKKA